MHLINLEKIEKAVIKNPLLSWMFNDKIAKSNIDTKYFIGNFKDKYGNKRWYKEGKRHRLDGPAIERSNGAKIWFKEGKRHRLDGPAIEYLDGDKYWYIEGVRYSSLEFERKKVCLGF